MSDEPMTDEPKKRRRWQVAAASVVAVIILAFPIVYMGSYYAMLAPTWAVCDTAPTLGRLSEINKHNWELVPFVEYSFLGRSIPFDTGRKYFDWAYWIDLRIRPGFWKPIPLSHDKEPPKTPFRVIFDR
jgi:hypothetical protein